MRDRLPYHSSPMHRNYNCFLVESFSSSLLLLFVVKIRIPTRIAHWFIINYVNSFLSVKYLKEVYLRV